MSSTLQSRCDAGASLNGTNAWLASAYDAEAVVFGGSDYVPACGIGRGFYVGVAGDVKIQTLAGNDCVIPACAAGVEHAIAFKKIYNSGTVATGVVALG